ncbi:MAG: DUF2680 domain-containing protein [Dethiobacter sp.]|jgi:cytochrome c-type biogenesis protein CcmH/NrfG|nr:DUF2680 domain-containing protein [Dethiobacter sp.]
MKKGLIVFLVVSLVLAVAVPVVLALTDSQKAELEALYEQEYEIKLQILDKQEESGLVNPEDAQSLRARLSQMWEVRKERMAEGNYSFGIGRGDCHGAGGAGIRGGGMMGRGGMMY